MRPTTSDLFNPQEYREISSFSVDDTLKFLTSELGLAGKEGGQSKTASYVMFGVSMLLGFLVMYFSTKYGGEQVKGIGICLLALFVVVLPIHEWIHGLTFKSFKAPDVGYGFSLKGGMVYAFAQDFPISMAELKKVALMPFLVITPILILACIMLPSYSVGIVVMLLLHTFMCVGDFMLAWYAIKNKDRTIYTYDDIRNKKKSYFFEKINS